MRLLKEFGMKNRRSRMKFVFEDLEEAKTSKAGRWEAQFELKNIDGV
jgi:hypothetical protein